MLELPKITPSKEEECRREMHAGKEEERAWGCRGTARAILTAYVAAFSQGTFQQMWISKQEYEEGGKQCVERKCP